MPLLHKMIFMFSVSLAMHLVAIQFTLAQPLGRAPMDAYLAARTEAIEAHCLNDQESVEYWDQKRPELERQLRDMLGLNPWPERTDMKATVVGRTQYDGYVVERIHFQSRPGLYVTANLYLPSEGEGPFPTILYVCGHAKVKEKGVSFGNKVGYHHHGVWFARHGYVCMMIDTIQLGEIEGVHHGTYSQGMWWWASRGYTPAGVEAWNSIRALDYLETRREVDAQRFGVTGRSGGGAYSWWAAALDTRIKVAVPVAGITDMRNHVIDGCIEGHCDCMFMVNQYAWDFPLVAALVAPRPLLITNTHNDGIFPLDGVIRVYSKVAKVYESLGAKENVAVHITEGPHKDTQALRVGAFAWFEKHLKGSTDEIQEIARKVHQPQQLRVFSNGTPEDQHVTDVHAWFVPKAVAASGSDDSQGAWMQRLHEVPGATKNVEGFDLTGVNVTKQIVVDEMQLQQLQFESTSPLQTFAILAAPHRAKSFDRVRVCVGTPREDGIDFLFQGETISCDDDKDGLASIANAVKFNDDANEAVIFLALQASGQTRWMETQRETTHLRRRLQLIGQSLDAIRASEIRSLLDLLDTKTQGLPVAKSIVLEAAGQQAVLAMLASLGRSDVVLELHQLPDTLDDGPILLGLTKAIDLTMLTDVINDNK